MTTHPKTGHECRTPKPENWGPIPNEITIKISRKCCEINSVWSGVCKLGTASCDLKHTQEEIDGAVWYAELSGEIMVRGKREPWTQLTHDYSPARAAFMAFDLLTILADECNPLQSPWNRERWPHCYCRDTTHVPGYRNPGDPEVLHYLQCCRCGISVLASEFE